MTTPQDPARVDYVRRVLDAYKATPGTTGQVRTADRQLALNLYARGVPLQVVLDALITATARRYARAQPGRLPATVRSLAYFAEVVNELLAEPIDDSYRSYIVRKLARCLPALGIAR